MSIFKGHDSVADPDAWGRVDVALATRWEHLGRSERSRVIDIARVFDRRWFWEGLDGLVVTDDMRAHVAGHAALLVLNIGPALLDDVSAVLIEPSSVVHDTKHHIGGGLVSETRACILGSALLHGPIKFAWDRVVADMGEADGSVVLHEFAHKIDMADGEASGTPPISDASQAAEFDSILLQTLDEVRVRPSPVVRSYGATNRAELFAVVTEALFMNPESLRAAHPALFGVLSRFYLQVPLIRGSR